MTQTVLVTGASGFIALHCIAELLRKGYTVRGSVRSANREGEVRQAVMRAAPEGGDLSFVRLDLTEDEGWRDAAEGCDYVLHVASPFPVVTPSDENDLIRPAVDGALRALKAAAAAGVKRTVLTSSVAAVAYGHPWTEGRVFTEDDWSDPDGPAHIGAYEKSKTFAERAAWEFMETPEAGEMELAVINPGAVIGPILSSDSGTSNELVRQLMARALPACPRIGFTAVDVRSVADAHVLAMTKPEAAGKRFICVSDQLWMRDIALVLDQHYGPKGWRIPTGRLPDFVPRIASIFNPALRQVTPRLGQMAVADSGRLRQELQWTPRPMEQAIVDAADSLIEFGVVKQ
ncbi:MAG: aldehyde reductase [Pseudomonadota bacterium]